MFDKEFKNFHFDKQFSKLAKSLEPVESPIVNNTNRSANSLEKLIADTEANQKEQKKVNSIIIFCNVVIIIIGIITLVVAIS